MSEQVKTGKCCWFDARKGVGFISKDDGSGDLFVHWSNIKMEGFKTLKQGQVVSFDLGENHKGVQAVNVKVLSDGDSEEAEQE